MDNTIIVNVLKTKNKNKSIVIMTNYTKTLTTIHTFFILPLLFMTDCMDT